jgi:hypothetical protein
MVYVDPIKKHVNTLPVRRRPRPGPCVVFRSMDWGHTSGSPTDAPSLQERCRITGCAVRDSSVLDPTPHLIKALCTIIPSLHEFASTASNACIEAIVPRKKHANRPLNTTTTADDSGDSRPCHDSYTQPRVRVHFRDKARATERWHVDRIVHELFTGVCPVGARFPHPTTCAPRCVNPTHVVMRGYGVAPRQEFPTGPLMLRWLDMPSAAAPHSIHKKKSAWGVRARARARAPAHSSQALSDAATPQETLLGGESSRGCWGVCDDAESLITESPTTPVSMCSTMAGSASGMACLG